MSGPQLSIFGDGALRIPPPRRMACRMCEVTAWPSPVTIRDRLRGVLARLQAADTMPLDDDGLRLWQLLFPQMSGALPAADAERLCAAFDHEVARLTGNEPDGVAT